MTGRTLRRMTAGAALVGLMPTGTRRVLAQWGVTDAEGTSPLPGDELAPEPARTTTRAVIVHAPGEHVWRWLVQIGQDRGGMYSYDWVENLFGLDIHSTQQIRPEWQQLSVGDQVRLVPEGWLGMADGYLLSVARVEPSRTLVLHDAARHVIWSFHIRVLDAATCRLIVRGRVPCAVAADAVIDVLMAPIEFAMGRRMLLGIKRRAESAISVPVDRRVVPEADPRWPPRLHPQADECLRSAQR